MIDIIGAISLTTVFALCCALVAGAAPIEAVARWKLTAVALAWFATIGVLSAVGLFAERGFGTPAIGVAILLPVALSALAALRSAPLRNLALNTPLAVLVGMHGGRILGVFFVLLFDAGRLPPTFALTAGWGDIAISLAALPLAWAVQRQVSGWLAWTFIWNALGLADLVMAVTLGVGSAPNSPVRFIFETPNSGAVATLPWVLIPALLVPTYALSHLAIFAQLGWRWRFGGTRRLGESGRLAWQ